MKNQKLLIIETSDIGARYTGEAVRKLGFEPVFLATLQNYQGDTLAQIKEFEHYDVPTTSLEDLTAFIETKSWDIAGITTFLDSRLSLAIELAHHFQVPGLDRKLLPFKDKGRVYDLGPQFSPPSICFDRSLIPLEEIESLRQKTSQIILKPRCTAGGIGARKFSASESLNAILNHIQGAEIPQHLQPNEWMAQGYVTGELVSVEGYVRHGEIQILGFTGRRKVQNTESWAGFPYDNQISERARFESKAKVQGLLKASGLTNAFFHIELMVNSEEAFIIDANLGRMGGGGIGEILASAYDMSPMDVFLDVLKISLFPNEELSSAWNRVPKFSVSVAYGLQTSAKLLKVKSAQTLNVFKTEILSEGTLIPAMGGDNWAWVGIVSGTESSVEDFLQKTDFDSSAGVQKACYAGFEARV